MRQWLRDLLRKQREQQTGRDEQLGMVFLGHLLILAGVTLIMLFLFGDALSGLPPKTFLALEAAIIVSSYLAMSWSSDPFVRIIEIRLTSLKWYRRLMDTHGAALKARTQATVLLAAFVLQFASLASLLTATGGPIDSPFAPMALAIAVFTPFIVNYWWTVGFIILTTMAFYAGFVWVFGFGFETGALLEFQAPASLAGVVTQATAARPAPSSYVAVNLFILLLASVMTLRLRDTRAFTMRRTFDAPRERVWEAWTDPDRVALWFGLDSGIDAEVELDVREGGTWKAAMRRAENKSGLPWTGVYREVVPPERLVFTLAGRPDQRHDLVSVELTENNGKTEMTVRQSDDGRFTSLKKGWSGFFDRMGDQLRKS